MPDTPAMPHFPGMDEDRAALDLLVRGFQVSRMLRLVADLGVADNIPPEGKTAIDALADACGAQPQQLVRVLRALAAFGVFTVAADGAIGHTPKSRLLRTDAPNSMHHSARFWAAPGSWAAWGMLDVAMVGEVPHMAAWGMARFDYLRSHPAEARGFDAMMANFPDGRHAAVAAAYDFSGVAAVADIGGGNGASLRRILPGYPKLRGVVFDREDVVRAIPPADLLDGRIEAVGGSFFDNVPPGADIYLLVRVLHDWPDGDARRILQACRRAMGAGAVLLVCEHLLEPDPTLGHPASYLVDTQMMAMFGLARERTRQEFGELLAAAGFALRRIVPTQSVVRIIEAVPV